VPLELREKGCRQPQTFDHGHGTLGARVGDSGKLICIDDALVDKERTLVVPQFEVQAATADAFKVIDNFPADRPAARHPEPVDETLWVRPELDIATAGFQGFGLQVYQQQAGDGAGRYC
jgi:hypothetical protein